MVGWLTRSPCVPCQSITIASNMANFNVLLSGTTCLLNCMVTDWALEMIVKRTKLGIGWRWLDGWLGIGWVVGWTVSERVKFRSQKCRHKTENLKEIAIPDPCCYKHCASTGSPVEISQHFQLLRVKLLMLTKKLKVFFPC